MIYEDEEEREYSDKDAKSVEKETKKIFKQFKVSPNFSAMPEYCQKEAENVVWALGEFTYGYDLLFPQEWTLQSFLDQVYSIQRKCMFSDSFFKSLPKVILSFSKFCVSKNIGKFTKKEIIKFEKDLSKGIYKDEFHLSWEEGHDNREKQNSG